MSLRAKYAMVRSQTPIMGPGGLAQKDWYLFFSNLWTSITDGTPQPEEEAVLDASPASYTAVIRGQAHLEGGTVSLVEFSRDGTSWYDTGITAGFVQMDARDQLRITYAVAPTLTYFPM